MKLFSNLSIRNKLIFIIVIVTTIIIGTGFSITIIYDNITFKNDMIKNTKINAQLISEYCIVPLTFGDQKVAKSVIEKIRTIPSITTACVYDEQNNLFVSYQKVPDPNLPDSIPEKATDSYEKEYYKLFYPIIYQDFKYGTIYLKTSTNSLKTKINRHLSIMLLLMVGLIFLSYFIALKLQSAISKPILDLTQTTEKISREADYSVRVEKHGYDEIGLLYDSFNEMLSQINTREKERDAAEKLLLESREKIKSINLELEQRVVQRTAQLVAANKELEAFAYSVAHDLRTPLRAIDGFCQILLDEHKDKLNTQGQDLLTRVRNGAQRMSQLIDDILKLSKVTRSEMIIGEVNLSAIANAIANELIDSDKKRKVTFSIQDGVIVNADEQLLRIVMENLLGNAWKFTSKHSKANIEFNCTKTDDGTVCFIRDDGAGFDMNYKNKLFKAFQRLHDSVEFLGTGIGLATVQRIIQRHGGKIWAEGEVEKGATFYFSLPQSVVLTSKEEGLS